MNFVIAVKLKSEAKEFLDRFRWTSVIISRVKSQKSMVRWARESWKSPAPQIVKQSVLLRYATYSPWIETGTYIGDTTEFLAVNYPQVISVEPSDTYFRKASERFKAHKNVTLINSTSEEILPKLVEEWLHQPPARLNFWLDGHWSAGDTFKGVQDTPVLFELLNIEKLIQIGVNVNIFIDDLRCFDHNLSEYSTYPDRSTLIMWAMKLNLWWTIEHDILIFKSSFVG